MSPRRKQRDNFVQSLFPFLAVLLSTMGALVLLLMLIVNQAQANAKQMATEKKMQMEDAESRLELLRNTFEEQLDVRRLDLERKRLTLQHLEKHIQELIEELKTIERTAVLLDSKQTEDKASETEKERKISQLEKQLADATIDLKKKLDNPEGNKPIFAIIPYQGTNGTHRRPIYLECIDKGIIIQPEGVMVGVADLRPPYGPGNPLDAAIRTVRSRFVPANGALTSTAYPLLIVRPSGVRTYAMARQAMSGWDDQFGYELIDEQLELTFPESEPGIKAEIEQALVLARDRQAALVMAMPAKYRQYINQGGSASDEGLEFEDDGGDLGDEWAGGSGTGSGSGGSGSGAGTSGFASGTAGGGNSGTTGGPGYRGGISMNQNGSGSATGLRGTGSQSGTGPQSLGFSGSGAGSGAGAGTGAGSGSGNQALSNDAGGVGAGGAPGGTSYFADGGPGQAGGASGSYFGSGGGADGSQFGDGSAGSAGGAGDGMLSDGSSRGGGGTGSSSAGSSASTNGASGQGGAASGQGGAASGPGGPAGMFGGSSGTAPSGAGGAGAASMGGMSSMAGNPAQDPTASPTDGSQPGAQQGAPSLNMDMTRNNQAGTGGQQSEPVARQRGRNWAWSEGPPSKTAVVRSIRVVCYSDRWVLMQDSTAPNQVTIPIGQSPQQSAERLAKAITDRVSGWGIALGGGYWKPELVVDIAPGAEARCTQLERLLEGSGLTVKRRTAK